MSDVRWGKMVWPEKEMQFTDKEQSRRGMANKMASVLVLFGCFFFQYSNRSNSKRNDKKEYFYD